MEWIAAGEVFKSGFRVSGDIGYDWFLLAFHEYIMDLGG